MRNISEVKEDLLEMEYVGFDDGANFVHQQIRDGIPFNYVQTPSREEWLLYAKSIYGELLFEEMFSKNSFEQTEAYLYGAFQGAAYVINVTYGNRYAGS